ncbi:hypothetical protein GCM10029964_068870 [Kibdelosporangium lantanae]
MPMIPPMAYVPCEAVDDSEMTVSVRQARDGHRRAGDRRRRGGGPARRRPDLYLRQDETTTHNLQFANGKPPGEAVVSTTAGIGAGIAADAAIGSVVPVAGTAVGAVGGAVVGWAASGAADAAWDRLSKSVTGPIDHGLTAGGEAVGHGVEKAWHSIF